MGPIGRGRRDAVTGLFVNLRATEALGREGLAGRVALTWMLRLSVNFLESKTSPSPMSRPWRKSSLSSSFSSLMAGFCLTGSSFAGSSLIGSAGARAGERLWRRRFRRSPKSSGPFGMMRPSKVSSSLSRIELAMLGLKAETDELRVDCASRRVPPNLVPRLPSAQSRSSIKEMRVGVLGGTSLLAESFSLPSSGSSKSCSKSSSPPTIPPASFWGVGGVMRERGLGISRLLDTLIVAPPSPKKSSSSSASRNRSRSMKLDEGVDSRSLESV